MEKTPLISVIVPVYKAENYLEKCVQSIRNQSYENLEIILIDDGSPDGSGKLCDEFAKEDSRIRVIHKENGGQASARNAALDVMHGEYVGFVDSDDRIEPDMYSRLLELIEKYDAQISACGTQLDYPDGHADFFFKDFADCECRQYSREEALRANLDNICVTCSLWDKLYKAEIFDGLRMKNGIIFEDMDIIFRCLERAEKLVYDPKPMYHYIMTDSSTMRSNFSVKRFDEAEVAKNRAEYFAMKYPVLYPKAMAVYIATALNIIHLSKDKPDCGEKRQKLIGELKGELPEAAVNELSKNERIKLRTLRRSVTAYEMMVSAYEHLRK